MEDVTPLDVSGEIEATRLQQLVGLLGQGITLVSLGPDIEQAHPRRLDRVCASQQCIGHDRIL